MSTPDSFDWISTVGTLAAYVAQRSYLSGDLVTDAQIDDLTREACRNEDHPTPYSDDIAQAVFDMLPYIEGTIEAVISHLPESRYEELRRLRKDVFAQHEAAMAAEDVLQ